MNKLHNRLSAYLEASFYMSLTLNLSYHTAAQNVLHDLQLFSCVVFASLHF